MPTPYDDKGVIKRPGLKMQMTKEQVMEIILCSKDIEYFAEKYFTIVGRNGKEIIKLRDYQKQMIHNFMNNNFSINMCPRQSGKCFVPRTYVKIRNKHTGIEEEILVEDFFKMIKNLNNKENKI